MNKETEVENEKKSRRQLRAEDKIKAQKMKKVRLSIILGGSVLVILIIALVFLFQYRKDDDIRVQINAAETGDAQAQYDLAKIYLENKDKLNPKKAFKLIKSASEQGHVASQYQLANFYGTGEVVKQDEKLALEYLEKSADGGYDQAQYMLGYYYYFGMDYEGYEKNLPLAVEWMEKAATQGMLNAQYALGGIYQNEEMLDTKKAFEWTQKAADRAVDTENIELMQQNSTILASQYELGIMYAEGIGTDVNKDKALEYVTKAADQKLPDAQYYLGNMYLKGDLIDVDKQKGIDYIKLSSDQGFAAAQYDLAKLYEKGDGVEKDEAKSKELMKAAADQNYALAKEYLGITDETTTAESTTTGK